MIEIFSSVMIIIGTLIGAGFASGQEIATFFNYFGDFGMYGIIIAAILFGIVIFAVLELIDKNNIGKYEDLIKNNKFILCIIKFFSIICFCIMVSAIGAYGDEMFGISHWYGAVSASVVCGLIFLFKYKGLEKLNGFLVPFILLGVFLLGTYNFTGEEIITNTANEVQSTLINSWWLSAILYAAYNSILLIPILVELKEYKLSKLKNIFISLITMLLFALLGLWIYKVINVYYPDILGYDIPTLGVAKFANSFISVYYSLIILFAVFTTAFSCGYAFLRMNNEKNYLRNTIIICVLAVFLSKIGFAEMINLFFPVFGYFGIAQFIIIALANRRRKK